MFFGFLVFFCFFGSVQFCWGSAKNSQFFAAIPRVEMYGRGFLIQILFRPLDMGHGGNASAFGRPDPPCGKAPHPPVELLAGDAGASSFFFFRVMTPATSNSFHVPETMCEYFLLFRLQRESITGNTLFCFFFPEANRRMKVQCRAQDPPMENPKRSIPRGPSETSHFEAPKSIQSNRTLRVWFDNCVVPV